MEKTMQEASGQVPAGKVCVEEEKRSKKPTLCVFERENLWKNPCRKLPDVLRREKCV